MKHQEFKSIIIGSEAVRMAMEMTVSDLNKERGGIIVVEQTPFDPPPTPIRNLDVTQMSFPVQKSGKEARRERRKKKRKP